MSESQEPSKGETQEEVKFSGSSITCPKCGYHWYRKPTMEERLYIASRGTVNFRDILAILDGDRCGICKKRFKETDEVTIDHIFPKSKGGVNNWRNYQLAHALCNQQKGDKIPDNYPHPGRQEER